MATDPHVTMREIQLGSDRIFYEEAGAGLPIVLVHGLAASGRWWRRNVPELARHFHVHVIDLVGFGHSRGAAPFVLRNAADTLVRWMDHLELERASLIGHSMGGFIAADLSIRHPQRINRLILVGAAILPLRTGYLHHAGGLVRAALYLAPSMAPVVAWDAFRAGPRCLLNTTHQLFNANIEQDLARIQAPTLMIWGQHDSLVPLDIARRARRLIRGSRLIIFPGIGHNPMWDRPAEFNQHVTRFLVQ